MLWITFDIDRDRHKAILDRLADWVPAARAKGKKVVLFGVRSSLWHDHTVVRDLLDKRILYASKHRACHRPLPPPEPLNAPSAVSFVALTTRRIPSQLCMCKGYTLDQHINDWATSNRQAYHAMMVRELLAVSVFLRGHSAGLSRGVDSDLVPRDPLMVRDTPSTSGLSRTPHHGTTAVCAPDSNTLSNRLERQLHHD